MRSKPATPKRRCVCCGQLYPPGKFEFDDDHCIRCRSVQIQGFIEQGKKGSEKHRKPRWAVGGNLAQYESWAIGAGWWNDPWFKDQPWYDGKP